MVGRLSYPVGYRKIRRGGQCNRPQHFATVAENNTEVFQILIRQIGQDAPYVVTGAAGAAAADTSSSAAC